VTPLAKATRTWKWSRKKSSANVLTLHLYQNLLRSIIFYFVSLIRYSSCTSIGIGLQFATLILTRSNPTALRLTTPTTPHHGVCGTDPDHHCVEGGHRCISGPRADALEYQRMPSSSRYRQIYPWSVRRRPSTCRCERKADDYERWSNGHEGF